ncbi:MauE/DoxX family redox-associated membrane protein [Massilia sp. YIM B02769]|uniref:MauE/DoxX family redox-associated membrane protein n=1 Tax=unclassified Massilia TaxID=2609279 RepID=UPI0025B6D535|nr:MULTISPECIES: MauE/DoxX family redox-associated membrane protein [unclassified Massilia]MDN4057956.1 MauE/DoxX family redox-associated membrane protein [Massilia sp. YIM B02769]
MTVQQFAGEMLRWFAAWWWLAAALGKLRTWPGFRSELGTSFGLAPGTAAIAAPVLVVAELAAASLLLAAPGRAGMALSFLLMLTFTMVLGYQFFTRGVVRCSCFGESARPLSGYDLLRNLLVLGAMGSALGLAPAQPPLAGEALVAAGIGAWLCVAAVNFHDLVVLTRTR